MFSDGHLDRCLCYGAAFAQTITRGLVAAPLAHVTVLSLTSVTAPLRAPQYATTSTSSWLHSPLQAAAWQSERVTRTGLSPPLAAALPGGPGGPCAPWGPAGPGSPFSPAGPAAPGSPFGPVVPSPQLARQTESAMTDAILFMCMYAVRRSRFSAMHDLRSAGSAHTSSADRPCWTSSRNACHEGRDCSQPRSDALENFRASHPCHAAIRGDVCHDPRCSDGRRADKASGPDCGRSAIWRPIPRRLERDGGCRRRPGSTTTRVPTRMRL
jgi:hypothetical protein